MHPQAAKLMLTAMLLSGENRAFRRKFLLQSWRAGTKLQYGLHIERWMSVCVGREVDPFQPPIGFLLDFLLEEFRKKEGRGYSSMNTIRSAISAIAAIDNKPAGQHLLVI